jgi:serine/threonine protein kinase
VGHRADIYSLGAVLYQLLTGRPPYEFGSLAELAEKQRTGTIVPVRDLEPSVPDELEALVMHTLARDPEFRPRSAVEVAQALATEPETQERPTVATAPTAPLRTPRSRRFQRFTRRSTWLWLALALAFVAAALILGLAGIGGGGSSPPATTAPRVQPIAPGATPADEARNLSRWLRANARR